MKFSKKVEKLYQEYLQIQEYRPDDFSLFYWTIKTIDENLYYTLQGKIFVESVSSYKELAYDLFCDIMKYCKKFEVDKIDIFVEEVIQFREDVPPDMYKACMARLKILNLA